MYTTGLCRKGHIEYKNNTNDDLRISSVVVLLPYNKILVVVVLIEKDWKNIIHRVGTQ